MVFRSGAKRIGDKNIFGKQLQSFVFLSEELFYTTDTNLLEITRVRIRKDMVPGWHSTLSLCNKFGRGSGVIHELKRIID